MKIRRLLACLIAATSLSGEMTVCAHEGHAAVPSTGVTLDGNHLLISPAAIKAIGMTTETITLGDIHHRLRVTARVALPWSGKAKVAPLTSGKIECVLVKPGQSVRKGQTLARIESLELESLQAELLQTAAEVELLERLIEQRSSLVASGGLAEKVVLENRSELQLKQAQHETALQKLHALGLDKAATETVGRTGETIRSIPVVSPIDGMIEAIDTQPGQLVESTDHLFDIIDLSTLYVLGDVLEGDAYLVDQGQPVEMTFSGRSEIRLAGHVDHLQMKMDVTRRSLKAVVAVDNRDGQLRPGMFGQMAIEVAAVQQEIVCPTSALIETERGTFVLKRETTGRFTRHPVELGMRAPDRVVVRAGLFPGQQVVSQGTHLLAAMYDNIPVPAVASRAAPGPEAGRRSPSVVHAVDSILAAKATVELPTSGKALATSLIEGRVAKIAVFPGQAIAAGQTLAEVESQRLRDIQLEQLQAAGKLRWTQAEVDRLRTVAESGKGLVREFRQRELELRMLSHKLTSLRRQLEMIGLSTSADQGRGELAGSVDPISGRIAIRSPISGRVADIGLTVGQLVHAHDSVFEIQNSETIWIRALVLEHDAARIERGQSAVATFPSNPALRVTGSVVRLAPQLTTLDRVLPVWIELPNPDGFLKDGMLARVEISVPKPSTAAVASPPSPSP